MERRARIEPVNLEFSQVTSLTWLYAASNGDGTDNKQETSFSSTDWLTVSEGHTYIQQTLPPGSPDTSAALS